MLQGLVQDDFPLSLQHVRERLRRVLAAGEVVTATGSELTRARYGEVIERVDRLAAGLHDLGVREGDRVATLSWNTQAHLEAYLAAPCMGAVLHTLNLRLFPDQLAYIVTHARDRVIVVDDVLVPLLARIAEHLGGVEHVVVVGDGPVEGVERVVRYEELLAGAPEGYAYPRVDERQACGLCYTSGTTGHPKGVLYSHRSTVLHAMSVALADGTSVCMRDRVMPVVPMFHANAWGLPYAACLTGADLVMPARFLQAEPLARLIEAERVTLAAAVPTIWMDLLAYADAHRPDLSSLRLVPCGGSAVPEALMRGFEERHGVRILHAWGMTETSPIGTVAWPPHGFDAPDAWRYRLSQGRLLPFVEARLVGDDGELPWDGESTGELQVRGPWVASGYYEADSEDKFDGEWLRTGDIASIDPEGYVRISDRAKDVIKSGGEWISSVELENELMAHEAVAEAAVIALPDERWSERPLACVVLRAGRELEPEVLRAHLVQRVARWSVPEAFAVIDEVPKTSTGKFDKKVLRARLAEGQLQIVRAGKAAEAAPAP
jgi:fatty-acyl-CoA synthase